MKKQERKEKNENKFVLRRNNYEMTKLHIDIVKHRLAECAKKFITSTASNIPILRRIFPTKVVYIRLISLTIKLPLHPLPPLIT